MKGTYKTKEGDNVEVFEFDEGNRIAYAEINGVTQWWPVFEYSTWVKEGEIEKDDSVETIPEVIEEPVKEETISEPPSEEIIIEKPIEETIKEKTPAPKPATPKKKK